MNLKAILEALLFVADTPLTLGKFKKILKEYSVKDIKQALKALQADYQSPEHGIELVEVAGGFRLQTKAEFRSYIISLKQKSPFRLSRSALETLAIIAYRQPITRKEIEAIKGVDVSMSLKTLLKLNLIKTAGRKQGSTALLYVTTAYFLEVFGLKDLSELPKLTDLS
ncbi:MAG TPA: SMC-Scp complex subunit ScpB [Candidatus Desulfofervidus auxilii]|uniref:SMC-Scp complex subunit ScpB n=1 Tax=Desulfofervidus auxilii TaxID=1621989 RepID=A0A7C0Y5U8_DESA2|nr:SMC-Scp complex subunit ScpB [Candidatus Desulfofervidus auxilii]